MTENVEASERASLADQYRHAVEEYRFQTDLNWRRSQYYFVLCAAVLAASFTLLANADRFAGALVALAFAATFIITLLAIAASTTQHGYYREARDKKAVLEKRLGLGEFALNTTPGMGAGIARRFGKVTTFQNVVFAVLAIVSVAGFATAVGAFGDAFATPSGRGPTVQTVCAATPSRESSSAPGMRCTTTAHP